MKKSFAVVGIAATLALSACGSPSTGGFESNNYDYGGYSSNGGWTDHDWDLNYGSAYNNQTYCSGGTYNPLPGNQYSCVRNGVTSAPAPRPKVIVPPKSQQKAPADVLKRVEQQKIENAKRVEAQRKAEEAKKIEQQKQAQQKAPAQQAPKAPAPAPKAPAPAPKAGK